MSEQHIADHQRTNPAHTPGPWRLCTTGNVGNGVYGFSGQKCYAGDDGFRTVAMFQSCLSSRRYDDEEANRLANGLLIAAAPDLYEALEDAAQHLGAAASIYDNHALTEMRGKCLAALAKARGEA